jgi:hypothetical protein
MPPCPGVPHPRTQPTTNQKHLDAGGLAQAVEHLPSKHEALYH